MAIPAGPLELVDDSAAAASAGNMAATYTDPSGYEWDLTDIAPEAGFFTPWGIKGWGATTYELTLDKVPGGGVSVRNVHANESRLTWPLHIYGDTHLEWLERYRALKRAFLMTVHRRKTGLLTVRRPDGSARQIDVMYEAGFEGEGGTDDWCWANPVLTLVCPDGYWRNAKPTIVPRAFNPGTSFFNPYPTVSPAAVLGDSLVHNPGDVDAWPTWVITGPADSVTAINNTTGRSFQIKRPIAAGELITIETKRPKVRGPNGENLVAKVGWTSGAYLWPLLSGLNSITVNVAGSAPGTAIEMRFYPRYEGA